MVLAANLPSTIPVFPLPGALLLPRARLPLHIFEPRYLAMLDDVLKAPLRLIGMIQPYVGPGRQNSLHSIGCAGRVTAFSETEDGRYMITLTGISRFRVADEVEGFTPYRKCNVDWSGFDRDLGATERDNHLDRPRFLKLLKRYFESEDLQTDWDSLCQAEDELLINSLSMLCPLDFEDKQALLEAPSLAARRETLLTLMEYALRGGSGEEVMQ
jgi:Lon protease-like protein